MVVVKKAIRLDNTIRAELELVRPNDFTTRNFRPSSDVSPSQSPSQVPKYMAWTWQLQFQTPPDALDIKRICRVFHEIDCGLMWSEGNKKRQVPNGVFINRNAGGDCLLASAAAKTRCAVWNDGAGSISENAVGTGRTRQ